MADQLYLSLWLRNYSESNMLRHYEKLLHLFPFSRLARAPSTFRVIPLNFTEPALLEMPVPAGTPVEQIVSSAQRMQNPDCCYRLDTWWDLWQFDGEWKLAPSRVVLTCFGPEFEREEGEHLQIEFGIDSHYLPQPEVEGSLRMVQSNIKSLLKLVHDIEDALPAENRQLLTESGENFSDKLRFALEGDMPARTNGHPS